MKNKLKQAIGIFIGADLEIIEPKVVVETNISTRKVNDLKVPVAICTDAHMLRKED